MQTIHQKQRIKQLPSLLREILAMRKQASKQRGVFSGQFFFLFLLFLSGCASAPEEVRELKIMAFPGPPDPARFYYERTLRGSIDIMPRESDDGFSLKEMVTGQEGGGGGSQFSKPFGVAAYKGRIYVSDTVKRSVTMLDPANGKHKEIGTEDPGSLSKPLGIDLDGQGNLYVVDASKKWVMVYDKDGKYIRAIGGPKLFDRPSAVAVNPEGTRLFVVDTGSSQGKPEFHRIQVFNPQTEEYLFAIGSRGSGDSEFNLPRAASIGPDSLLYVADGGNFRVQIFDQKGKFIRKFGSVGRRLGQFARPKGIDLDKHGNLYVSDASHANFQIFDPKGQLLMFIGSRGPATEPAKYLLPAMVALDEDDRIYMVDQAYKKVDVFRPATLKIEEGSLGLAFESLKILTPKEKQ